MALGWLAFVAVLLALGAAAYRAATGRALPRPPAWALALAGGLVAGVALRLGLRRGVPAALPSPPPPTTERVRVTAGDILARQAAERQARIDAAASSAEPEREIADLTNARRRRP